MNQKILENLEDFQNLKKWDNVICEFHRDIKVLNKSFRTIEKTRIRTFNVALNKEDTKEIILNLHSNIYFNYEMFLNWESNLKEIILITN